MCRNTAPWKSIFPKSIYYASILLFAFANLLFQKFCRHNQRIPNNFLFLMETVIKWNMQSWLTYLTYNIVSEGWGMYFTETRIDSEIS